MCFYFRQSKDALAVANRFKAKFRDDVSGSGSCQSSLDVNGRSSFEMVNGFSHPKCPVITDSEPGFIDNYIWGLIPFFAVDTDIQKYTLNARIETVDIKPSFRNNIGNRCLVITDGFYEWKEVSLNGKKFKQKHLITMPDEQLFAFAGLYSFWNDRTTGDVLKTFTILTTEANSVVAAVHAKNRMPVILNQEEESLWLDGAPHRLFADRRSLSLKSLIS
ncbi:MAG: hypothetical protein A2X19_04695 [Bacteroidetes bacterium GWE2_39_28]|nr:MAG: hypothetical protein A2X19_04695 [Bacteroidetes bacterium GWE2_39_28]OFY14048.1 MAG: hypothetical protein A2X16_04015 [Bacteroidetes bacterium GWF2_39_10]OFZ06748.1 MAG: hypothetical protein A2322_09075 [Bacteroidetes bacterium RIFOXYB2_FULL_39_7]OFZ09501.1 MAG: hypothetical protein A2465_03630 [Bacteroidetes bacterium RIFOXYC2_FULL_39_11]HCT93980.1 SOS response-associated peptidase [Rikenellaceae bacterium]